MRSASYALGPSDSVLDEQSGLALHLLVRCCRDASAGPVNATQPASSTSSDVTVRSTSGTSIRRS
jgi:hypothetical protein